MDYAIEILKNKLESEEIVLTKVDDNFKYAIEENIEDLKCAIANLETLNDI